MKKFFLISVIVFAFSGIKAQQTPIPGGPSTISISPKEIMPGMYAKSFNILYAYTEKRDSSVKAEVILHIEESTGNGSAKKMQQLNKTFKFSLSAFAHNPPTRADVVAKLAEAMGVQIQ